MKSLNQIRFRREVDKIKAQAKKVRAFQITIGLCMDLDDLEVVQQSIQDSADSEEISIEQRNYLGQACLNHKRRIAL